MENSEILTKVCKFIKSSRNDNSELRNIAAWKHAYENPAKFWTGDRCTRYGVPSIGNHHHHSILPRFVQTAVQRMTKSSWHIQLKGEYDAGAQESVNAFENEIDSRCTQMNAIADAFSVGMGVVHIASDENGPHLEHIKDVSNVYVDPFSIREDWSDANEIAIVSFIDKSRAESLHGATRDVIEFSTNSNPMKVPDGHLSEVMYYYRDENGVNLAHIVGDVVVNTNPIPLTYIPVVRFAGYPCDNSYIGFMQKTEEIQALSDIQYDKVLKRVRTHHDVQAVVDNQMLKDTASKEALKGWAKNEIDILPVQGGAGSVTFENNELKVADLAAIDAWAKDMMCDALGMTLDYQYVDSATEALIQDQNADGAIHCIWNHAHKASKTIARIVLQILFGEIPDFELLNGPDSINADLEKQKKCEKYLNLANSSVNETQKSIFLYYATKECGDDSLIQSIRATLGDALIDEGTDVGAIKAQANDAYELATLSGEQIDELNRQLQTANEELTALRTEKETTIAQIQLQKQQQELERQKEALNYQKQIMELQAKLLKMEADTRKVNAEAEDKEITNAERKAELLATAEGV